MDDKKTATPFSEGSVAGLRPAERRGFGGRAPIGDGNCESNFLANKKATASLSEGSVAGVSPAERRGFGGSTPIQIEGKNILVCGMARSGQAAAKLLKDLGAIVTLQDLKEGFSKEGLEDFKFYLGKNPDDIVGDFDLIVISPGISVYAPFVKKAQSMGIPIWGEAELAYLFCPCPMIAITGTNGKTTVTTLVGDILKLYNPKTVIAGNIGIPLTGLVTGLDESHIVVAEISSFQLETIAAFKPAISAVLNMTPDHLDRHITMENYIATKSRIFENQRQDDFCVLNYDNDITKVMQPPSKVVYFSTKDIKEATVFLRDDCIYSRFNGVGSDEFIVDTSELKIMTENALAATALSLCAGVPAELVAKGLKDFNGIAHRLEYVATINNVEYYNDSKATNIDSTIKALESFNKPITLICGGYDKKADFTTLVELFSQHVAKAIVIGQTREQIISTCDTLGFTAYERAETLQEAVEKASKTGFTILFSPACASLDMFKNFEERGDLFKKYVLDL